METMIDPSTSLYIRDEEAGESSIDSTYPPAVASGRLTHFVPLPTDPAVPLTTDQLNVLFPQASRTVFCRELAKLARSVGDA